ncbi:hypothetical protein WN48_05763 [Eufriesea mexicana]|uniref:Uncharacterized protein n=1 Tax=Eufriesea mexicana TaxID=516756 RepID=A0A310SCH6_9HYME|nr:hypothetical protein WN48_05763 [Eufriesea mexicana]
MLVQQGRMTFPQELLVGRLGGSSGPQTRATCHTFRGASFRKAEREISRRLDLKCGAKIDKPDESLVVTRIVKHRINVPNIIESCLRQSWLKDEGWTGVQESGRCFEQESNC